MSAASSSNTAIGATFVADVRTSLRAEFGARAIYGFLSRRTDDPELAGVLARFGEEGDELVAGLSHVLGELGVRRVPTGSARRTALAWLLALVSRRRRGSLALRMCLDSEERLGRSYASYAEYLSRFGRVELARRCEALAGTKQRHARVLSTWALR